MHLRPAPPPRGSSDAALALYPDRRPSTDISGCIISYNERLLLQHQHCPYDTACAGRRYSTVSGQQLSNETLPIRAPRSCFTPRPVHSHPIFSSISQPSPFPSSTKPTAAAAATSIPTGIFFAGTRNFVTHLDLFGWHSLTTATHPMHTRPCTAACGAHVVFVSSPHPSAASESNHCSHQPTSHSSVHLTVKPAAVGRKRDAAPSQHIAWQHAWRPRAANNIPESWMYHSIVS